MSTELLCQAIAKRSKISFTHQGARYIVEPYSVGYEMADADGKQPLLLRAWVDNGWRDFAVKFMSRVEIDGDQFSSDRTGHQRMRTVICDVYGKTWPPTDDDQKKSLRTTII